MRAATLGGAIALGMQRDSWLDPRGEAQAAVGAIRPGARADIRYDEM